MNAPFKLSQLFSAVIGASLIASSAQAEGPRIENVTVYAGKQSEVTVDLSAIGSASHATITPGGPYLKHRLPLSGKEAFDIVLGEHYAFLASGDDGVLIVDVTSGAVPTVVSRFNAKHSVERLALSGSSLYLSGEKQLSLVDLSDPLKPKQRTTLKMSASIIALDADVDGAALLLSDNSVELIQRNKHNKLTQVSSVTLDSKGHDIALNHGRIYLAMGEQGITVLNSSDPTNITTLYRYLTSGDAVDLAISDGVLYVATTTAGLTLFDIPTPDLFKWRGSHQKVGHALQVDVTGEYAMVLNGENQLVLVDGGMADMPSIAAIYNDPRQTNRQLLAIQKTEERLFAITRREMLEYDFSVAPPQVSNEGLDFGQGVNFGGQRRGFILDDTLYVADWFSGIHLYDISNPHRPQLLSSLKTKGSPKGIVVRDDYAYVADDDHGLLVVDVSDPNQPEEVATLLTAGLAYIPKLQGDLLYLASHRGGFQIIDIGDPKQPKLLSSTNTAGKAWGIQVRGDHLFIADDESGLLIFDSSDPANPKQISQFAPGGAAEDVAIDGDYAYVTFFDHGVYIVDISDLNNPAPISHLPTPGNARGVERSGDHLYIADWLAGMQVIDIREPMQPRIVGSYDTEGAAWGLGLKDDHAYIYDWWGGLAVLDISRPQQPTLISRYLGNGQLQQVTARDKFLFVASGIDSLQLFDINNPLNPTWFTGVDLESAATAITLDDDLVFVAQENRYVSIIDISNPFESELLKQIKLEHDADIIRIANDQLYVASVGNGVTVIDITKPHAPLIRTTYHIALSDLWNYGNTLYLTTDEQRLEVIDSSNPGQLKRTHSFKLNSNATLLRGTEERLYLYQPGSGILVLDIATAAQPRVITQIPIYTEVSDFQIDDDSLYVATEGRYLSHYRLSDNKQWQLLSRYSTSGNVDRFTLHRGVLYFSGSSNMTALKPLPQIELVVDRQSMQLNTTLPKAMPLGGYHLVVADESGATTTLYNAIKVEMKPFGKGSFSIEDLKKAMQKKQADSANDKN